MNKNELIVVSNSAPFPGDEGAGSGGLATGILAAMREKGGYWIATHKDPKFTREPLHDGKITFQAVKLTTAQAGHYRLANSLNWPLQHGLDTEYPAQIEISEKIDYSKTNQILAAEAVKTASRVQKSGDNPIIWVQDYQCLEVPKMIKDTGYKGVVGFFLHTPFPGKEDFALLAEPAKKDVSEMYKGMMSADQIGFHDKRWRKNFLRFRCRKRRAGWKKMVFMSIIAL